MKKFLLFLFVFFMAVNMGSWYTMCKYTVWWMATIILEEPATSIKLQNFGSCPPYCTALHRNSYPIGPYRCCDYGMGGYENILPRVPKDQEFVDILST